MSHARNCVHTQVRAHKGTCIQVRLAHMAHIGRQCSQCFPQRLCRRIFPDNELAVCFQMMCWLIFSREFSGCHFQSERKKERRRNEKDGANTSATRDEKDGANTSATKSKPSTPQASPSPAVARPLPLPFAPSSVRTFVSVFVRACMCVRACLCLCYCMRAHAVIMCVV